MNCIGYLYVLCPHSSGLLPLLVDVRFASHEVSLRGNLDHQPSQELGFSDHASVRAQQLQAAQAAHAPTWTGVCP